MQYCRLRSPSSWPICRKSLPFCLVYKLKLYHKCDFFSVDLEDLLILQIKNNKFISLPEITHCLMCLSTQALYSFATRVWVEVVVPLFRLGLSHHISFKALRYS